ncbi:MAG: hypothetical protein QXS02_01875 [Candidatus Thermoplasmatota archaeon]
MKAMEKAIESPVMVQVKCDWCGKEIECPEETMKKTKKHMCYECFTDKKNIKSLQKEEPGTVHINMTLDQMIDKISEDFSRGLTDDVFPEIWRDKKIDLKELSKKDLAREMFSAGVFFGVQAFMDSMQNLENLGFDSPEVEKKQRDE